MTSGSLKTWKKWSQGVCGRRWRKWMYYQCFLINIKIWCIIRLFVLLCAFVECQCVLAYQTQTHSQDPWDLITRRIHCIPKWQLLFNLNALQEGHLVGMFPWEPMTYIDASSYTACRRLWVINCISATAPIPPIELLASEMPASRSGRCSLPLPVTPISIGCYWLSAKKIQPIW